MTLLSEDVTEEAESVPDLLVVRTYRGGGLIQARKENVLGSLGVGMYELDLRMNRK